MWRQSFRAVHPPFFVFRGFLVTLQREKEGCEDTVRRVAARVRQLYVFEHRVHTLSSALRGTDGGTLPPLHIIFTPHPYGK